MGAVLGFSLGALFVSACERAGDSPRSEPPAPAPPSSAVAAVADSAGWRQELTKVCSLPSAAPASLQQRLALPGTVKARQPSSFSRTHVKCVYHTQLGQLALEVDLGARSLASARRMFEKTVGVPKDYPDFGDEAFLITVPAGSPPLNSLAVRKGDVVIVLNAHATPEAMQAALTALYADMGMHI